MITIILHHAALELANDKICNMVHKAIINDARARRKKPTELLLDIAVHQSAIYPEKLQFSGRPDLVHFFLLQYHHMIKIIPEKYSSEINLYVHTKNNQIFFVPQSWRVPVHFIRFRGLMEKFLIEKTINFTNTDKIELQETTLKELIESLDPTQIFNLTELGEENENFMKIIDNSLNGSENIIIMIGGYQKGEIIIDELLKYPFINIRLLEKPTTAWVILSILLTGYILKKD